MKSVFCKYNYRQRALKRNMPIHTRITPKLTTSFIRGKMTNTKKILAENIFSPIQSKQGTALIFLKASEYFPAGLGQTPPGGRAGSRGHHRQQTPARTPPWPSSEVRAGRGSLSTWMCPPATLADQTPTSAGGAHRGIKLSAINEEHITKPADTKSYPRRLRAVSLPTPASPGCPHIRYNLERILKERGD